MYIMVYCLTIFEEKLARPVERFSYIGTILRWICARRKISTLHIQLFILHQQSHSFSVFGQLGTFITIIETYFYHFWNSAIGDIHQNATLQSHVPEAPFWQFNIYLAHISCVILIVITRQKQKVSIQEWVLHQKVYILNALTHISLNGKTAHLMADHILHFWGEIWPDSTSISLNINSNLAKNIER